MNLFFITKHKTRERIDIFRLVQKGENYLLILTFSNVRTSKLVGLCKDYKIEILHYIPTDEYLYEFKKEYLENPMSVEEMYGHLSYSPR